MDWLRGVLDASARFLSALVPALLAYLASKERAGRQAAEAEAERLKENNAILQDVDTLSDADVRERLRQQQHARAKQPE